MTPLTQLRKLAESRQFTALKTKAGACLAQTGDIRLLPLVALACAYLGEVPEAVEAYQQAAERMDELDTDARVDLAGVDCLLLRIDEAEQLLEPVLEENPAHALALARLAWCRLHRNWPDEALRLYLDSVALDPDRIPVWVGLSRLYLHREDCKAAGEALYNAELCFERQQGNMPQQEAEQFTALLNGLHLEIRVVQGQFAAAEEWLTRQQGHLAQEAWVPLVTGYATLLAGRDCHAQAGEVLREALMVYPRNDALLLHLADLEQAQGHFMQAVRLLRRAIGFDRENPELWSRLSSACLHRFDKQARIAAEKSLALAAELTESDEYPRSRIRMVQAQAKNTMAQVESQEQNFETAEHLFGEVLEQSPHFVPALQGLAHQQMQLGKIDEALELYGKIKRVDPLKAHSALINARHYPEDVKILERMEKAANMPSLEGPVRSGILFQVAAAREKRREYPKALELARQANEAARRFLSYDAREHRNRCARIRNVFSSALFKHRPDCGHDSTLPVYVLGMPRSGTTLVEQIIAGHSKIFGAGELGVIPGRIQGLNRWERHVGSGRAYPDCVDDLTPYVTKGIANGVLKDLKELAADEKPEAEYVVDKLPHNFENVGFIKFLFPNAKIISVRRDPRDIAISNYFTNYQARHGGMGFAYDLTHIGEQLADHNLLMHHWHQLFPGEILEINYEDVVDDLEGVARRMLDYIGVGWEEQVLAFNELERPVKTASVWQVRQPIYKTARARWMNYCDHLAPLIEGTNARIEPDPITDMITLPEPGFLQDGVALFQKGDLDGAELSFKKMLHHNPAHAACNYMVGLVYCRKGHVADAVPLFETAVEKCPWQREWRENLAQAYRETGQPEKAEALEKPRADGREAAAPPVETRLHTEGYGYGTPSEWLG